MTRAQVGSALVALGTFAIGLRPEAKLVSDDSSSSRPDDGRPIDEQPDGHSPAIASICYAPRRTRSVT